MRKNKAGVGRPTDLRLRQRILDTTMALLKRRDSLRSITVDEIAELAETSKATIYKHWSSKSALFVEAFFDAVKDELHFDESSSRLDALKQQARRLAILLSSTEGNVLRTLIAESHSDPAVREALLEGYFLPRRTITTQFVTEMCADGALKRNLSPDIVVDVLYGPLFYALMVGYRRLDLDWVDAYLTIVLDGAKPDKVND